MKSDTTREDKEQLPSTTARINISDREKIHVVLSHDRADTMLESQCRQLHPVSKTPIYMYCQTSFVFATMTKFLPSLRLLATICCSQMCSKPVLGWGQAYQFRGRFMSTAFLKATSNNNEEDESGEVTGFRERLERTYSAFDGDDTDPLGAFIQSDISIGEADGQKVSEEIGALDRVFNVDPTDEADYTYYCEGNLCDPDECLIPETFKIVPGKDSLDVMSFLGIQRAAPLRAKKEEHEDWQ